MEEKLNAYRAKKRRQKLYRDIINYFLRMVSFQSTNSTKPKEDTIVNIDQVHQTDIQGKLNDDKNSVTSNSDEDNDSIIVGQTNISTEAILNSPQKNQRNILTYFTWLLYFLFWATCYAIAIELSFGVVYLMFSGLLAIYFNTRTGPKDPNEISAYSVFNKDCHSIDGTLKGEQFDKEIRYGPTSVR